MQPNKKLVNLNSKLNVNSGQNLTSFQEKLKMMIYDL